MAIKIPSKSIYEKNNSKVRDNVIERMEVGAVEVAPNNEYEVSVYNEKFYDFELSNSSFDLAIASVVEQSSGSYWEAISYIKVVPTYKNNINFVINAIKNNHFISKVNDGEKINEDGTKEPNIKYNIEYKKYSGDITGTIRLNKPINPSESESYVTANLPTNIIQKQGIGEIPKLNQTYEKSFSRSGYLGNSKAISEIKEISDKTNLANIKLNFENDIYTSKDTATILSGMEIIKLGNVINNADIDEMGSTRELSGSYEKYEPLSIEITIYGNTIGIDLQDKTVYIPSEDKTSKKVHSIDGNELMQKRQSLLKEKCYFNEDGSLRNSTKFYCTKDLIKVDANNDYKVDIFNFPESTYVHSVCFYDENKEFIGYLNYSQGGAYVFNTANLRDENKSDKYKGINYSGKCYMGMNFYYGNVDNGQRIPYLSGKEYYKVNSNIYSVVQNYNKVIDEYKNGKETATIRCSIVDYYDENGKVVVSPSKSYLYDYAQHATNGNAYVQMDEFGYVSIPTTAEIQSRAVGALFNQVLKVDLPYGEYELSISDMSPDISGFIQLDHSTDYPNTEEEYYRIYFNENNPKTVKFNVNSIKETFYLHLDVLLTDTRKTFKVEINGKKTKMLFEQYDEVIPMVIDKNGQDNPMSFYKDGKPKKFKVLSVRPYFDGAVWQELSLQEIDN